METIEQKIDSIKSTVDSIHAYEVSAHSEENYKKKENDNMNSIGDGYAWNRIYDTASYGGYPTLQNYHTSRDVLANRADNKAEHCKTNEIVNRNARDIENTMGRDFGNQNQFIDGQIDSVLRGQITIREQLGDFANRATNAIIATNDKLCELSKEQAVASALAGERDKNLNHKIDALTSRNEADDAFARQLAKFQSVNGCQPPLSSCGVGN